MFVYRIIPEASLHRTDSSSVERQRAIGETTERIQADHTGLWWARAFGSARSRTERATFSPSARTVVNSLDSPSLEPELYLYAVYNPALPGRYKTRICIQSINVNIWELLIFIKVHIELPFKNDLFLCQFAEGVYMSCLIIYDMLTKFCCEVWTWIITLMNIFHFCI